MKTSEVHSREENWGEGMDEIEVVKKMKKRDVTALQIVMAECSKSVYAICYKILSISGTKEDIEEAMNDTFLKVWEDIHKYEEMRGTLKTWVYTIAKYQSLEIKRKRDKEKGVITEINDNLTYLQGELRELLMDLDLFSTTLSTEEKDLLRRRFYLEQNIEEIAEELQVKRTTVDTRLWRLRKGLKSFFSVKGGE